MEGRGSGYFYRVWNWVRVCFAGLSLGVVAGGCIGTTMEIVPAELRGGIAGVLYEESLGVEGGNAAVWLISSGTLPPGIDLDSDDGSMSGVPIVTGVYEFTVSARAESPLIAAAFRSFAIEIFEPLEVNTDVTEAREAQIYEHRFVATGGVAPYAFDLIGLPAGLSFDELEGTISGTPLTPNPSVLLELTVTDDGPVQQTLRRLTTLVIKPIAVRIMTTTLSEGQVNVAYSELLEAMDGTPPYTWAVVGGVLPDGLRLNTTTGLISGRPTKAQVETITIRVTDSDDPSVVAMEEFVIEIGP